MPGKLIDGHKKIENKCDLCHAAFDKKSQNKMCLACHKKINKDIVQKRGYHGKERLVIKKYCKYCHTDHVGRKADIVDFDRLGFNHSNTDFKLSVIHKKTSCMSCHKKNRKYRDAVSECIGCHKKDDIHKTRLGKNCVDCHKNSDWRKAKFDHNKTKYSLKGAHKKVSCGACHPNQLFKATPVSCIACHKVQDIHRGEFGKKCKKCHVVKKWKNIRFDHDKDTKFKLRDRHKKISCGSCHVKNAYKVKLKKDCFSCHGVDDKHNGNYGKKCNDCHTDSAWGKVKFKHDRDTKFKLIGVHSKIACSSCHLGRIAKEKKRKYCKNCHGQDDIHNGKLKKQCDYCHDQFSWSKRISFDHDLTNFPLLGLHGLSACESCHHSSEFVMKKHECYSCHREDDEHKLKLTSNCKKCHNPNGWGIWVFSHSKQTDYELTGEHKKVECVACHKETIDKKKEIILSDRCESCHGDDDVHSGAFGKRCNRCHQTDSFENVSKLRAP